MKPFTVKLTQEHQQLFLDLLADSYDYKATKKLRSQTAITTMAEYYISAAEKIRDNNIEIWDTKNNLFSWILDQLRHSGEELWQTSQCQRAQRICASIASNSYNQLRLREAADRIFKDLQ